MAKHDYPSSGRPFADADKTVGEFAPDGQPVKLNVEGVQVPKTDADEALAEFAAAKAGGKSTSVKKQGKIDVPLDGPKVTTH